MSIVSIVIPSRNEKYLEKTVEDVFDKAAGEIEVIVVIDGANNFPLPKTRRGLKFIKKSKSEGLRPALKSASSVAKGKYLMKIDAHSAVSEGFDEVLKRACDDNWVVVSRYYQLDTDSWKQMGENTKSDYFYLGCPWTNHRVFMFWDVPWVSRDNERKNIMIDDQMTIQASLWFMTKEHFDVRLQGLDENLWGAWSCEQEEIALKTWLGGGRVIINKKVWNAHYHRPHEERRELWPEFSNNQDFLNHRRFTRYWLANKWEGRVHDFDWLMDKFWPLPPVSNSLREKYGWPENWRDYYEGKLSKYER